VVVGGYEDTTEPFTLQGIKVTSPSGTEIWAVSDITNYIQWVSVGFPGPYNLSFSLWENESVVYSEQIDTGVSGSPYEWIMTSNAIGSNVTIRVTDPLTAGGFTADSEMFEVVAQPSIRITSPADGEFWKVSEANVIRWTLGGKMSNDFHLAYSYTPFEQTNLLGTGEFDLEANECSFTWSPIPNRLGPARIICVNQVDDSIADTADGWIIAPRFQITPFVGNVYALEPTSADWFNYGSVSAVDLYYSTDPDRATTNWVLINTEGPFTSVVHNQPSTYLWTVPNVRTSSMWLRIQDHDYVGTVFDASEPGPYNDLGMFTVQYYTIVWRVYDEETTNELDNLSVSDTVGWSASDLTSPVTNFYPYGVWDTVWFREYFHDKVVLGWVSNPSREIDVWLERSEIEPEYHVMANFTYSYTETNFTVQAWLERGGAILETPDRCRIKVYDSTGALIETLQTADSDNGVFWQTWNVLDSLSEVKVGDVFFAKVEIDYSGITYSSGLTFTLLQAASASIENVIDTIETSTDSIRDDIDDVASSVSNLTSMTSETYTNVAMMAESMTNEVLPSLALLTNEIGVIASITNLADAIGIIGDEMPGVLARILTRVDTMILDTTNSVLYKTRRNYGDDVVTLTVSDANEVVVASNKMSEVLTGIYHADVDVTWGPATYTMTCADPAAHDSMVVRTVRGDIYKLPDQLAGLTGLDEVVTNVQTLVAAFEGLDTNVFDLADTMAELGSNVTDMAEIIQNTDLGVIGSNVALMADQMLGVDMVQMSSNVTDVLASVSNMAGLVGTDLSQMAVNISNVLWSVDGMATNIAAADFEKMEQDVTNTLAAVQSLTSLEEIVAQLSTLSNTVASIGGVTNIAADIDQLTNALGNVQWSDVIGIKDDVSVLTNMVSSLTGLEALADQIGVLSNAMVNIGTVTNIAGELQAVTEALGSGDLGEVTESVNSLSNALAATDFEQMSTDVASISGYVEGAYLSNVWNQVQGAFLDQVEAGLTDIQQSLGTAEDAESQNTFFGRLARMSSRLTTIGADTSTAVLRAQGAKRSADTAAAGIDDVMAQMAKGDLDQAIHILSKVQGDLAAAEEEIKEIPKGVAVEEVYDKMRNMADQMNRFAESRGFKGLLDSDLAGVEGAVGGAGGAGADEKTVGSLHQVIRKALARMDFVAELLDESQRKPVIKEGLFAEE